MISFAVLAFLLHVAPAAGQLEMDFLSGRFKASRVTVPFYDRSGLSPTMIVRADSIHPGYERKGFFRIGVLPIGVIRDGVTFEILRPDAVTNALTQFSGRVKTSAARRLELNKVSFQIITGETNLVECGRVRIEADDTWLLSDAVRLAGSASSQK